MNASIETLARIANQATDLGKTATTEKPGYLLPFIPVTGAQPYAAGADVFMSVVPRPSVRFRRLRVAVYVAAPNDNLNYWTITLKADAAGNIASVDTSAVTATTWTIVETTTFAPLFVLDTAETRLIIDIAVGAGAPGTIRMLPSCYVL